MIPFLLRIILFSLFLVAFTACSSKPQPVLQAVVGQWGSDTSTLTFEFFANRTFVLEDPDRGQLTGTYRVIGKPESLANAEFALKGGYDIRFTPKGDAFYIYIDGAGSPSTLYHRKTQ